ncbi:MAG TPA: family 1 glycosylhydrolase, partial [Polyangiaceae bacterium]|nr:family 1 glycosylhydrolase [Polyangiaceae bacterium]
MTTAPGRVFGFPPSFLFGTATSATQIEGGCTTSDWYVFAKQPARTKNGDTPDVACDGWHRFREDIDLQKGLGLSAYRMSIEWARIEPRPGETNAEAIDKYREMLGALREAGIEVLVTLHHFTLPLWLAQRGGLLAAEFPERLVRFARLVVDSLGDLCRLWVTTNEPNVLAAQAYLLGVWPPAKTSLGDALLAQYRLLQGHVGAYRVIKEARGDDARVGIAHHLRIADAANPESLLDRSAARLLERIFSDAFALALCEGRMLPGVDWMYRHTGGFDVRDARGTQDF